MLLTAVRDIELKMDNLSQHLTEENYTCHLVFNTLSGKSTANNRINTTRDLYRKIYAELPDVTVADFFSAFDKINKRGILARIHDDFHQAEDCVTAD